MKKQQIMYFCLFALLSIPLISLAQEANKETVKVRIETFDKNGNKKIIEKEINTAGLSEEERDKRIEEIQDEAMKDISSSRKMKIIIRDSDDSFENEDRFSFGDDEDFFDSEDGDVHVFKQRKTRKGSGMDDFEIELDRFGNELRVLGEDLPRKMSKALPRIYTWNDGIFITDGNAGIQGLDVFPNRPATSEVNVRFYAAKEGDVTITILDTKGNIVGKSEFEAFEGDFAGQVKLDAQPKGTYFVIVSQGDDGVSRKVTFE